MSLRGKRSFEHISTDWNHGTGRVVNNSTASVPKDSKGVMMDEGDQQELSTFTNNIHVNHSAARNGCNLALAHGKNWTERWKDNRPLLNRIFMPSLYFNEGLSQPVIACNAGVQGLQVRALYLAPQLAQFMLAAQQLAGSAGLPKPFDTETTSPNVSSLIQVLASGHEREYNKIMIPLAENRHTFMNDTNVHSELLIYEYVCKNTCSSTTESPLICWQNAYTTFHEAVDTNVLTIVQSNTLTADSVANVNETVIGERPHGKALSRYWKQLSFTRLNLPPGKTVQWVTHACKHSICYNDIRTWIQQGQDSDCDCIPGWTKYLLFIIRGQLVGVKSGPTQQTFSSANIRHEFETQTALWQPYRYQQKKCIGRLTTEAGAGPGIWPQPAVANQLLFNNLTDATASYTILT